MKSNVELSCAVYIPMDMKVSKCKIKIRMCKIARYQASDQMTCSALKVKLGGDGLAYTFQLGVRN